MSSETLGYLIAIGAFAMPAAILWLVPAWERWRSSSRRKTRSPSAKP